MSCSLYPINMGINNTVTRNHGNKNDVLYWGFMDRHNLRQFQLFYGISSESQKPNYVT